MPEQDIFDCARGYSSLMLGSQTGAAQQRRAAIAAVGEAWKDRNRSEGASCQSRIFSIALAAIPR
jgi:hypothetical protein